MARPPFAFARRPGRVMLLRMKFLLVTLLLALTFVGCRHRPPDKAAHQPAAPRGPLSKHGMPLAQAQTNALLLLPGYDMAAVTQLFKLPDETALKTYGALTRAPWNGLEWTYRWGGAKRLTVVFEFSEAAKAWLVNHWEWSKF